MPEALSRTTRIMYPDTSRSEGHAKLSMDPSSSEQYSLGRGHDHEDVCRKWACRHLRISSNSTNIWPASTSWSEGTLKIYEAAMPPSYQRASPPKTGSAFAPTLEQKSYSEDHGCGRQPRSYFTRQSPAFSCLP